jgi:hypothetical protein
MVMHDAITSKTSSSLASNGMKRLNALDPIPIVSSKPDVSDFIIIIPHWSLNTAIILRRISYQMENQIV